ncbi:hypothetical protein NN561_002326 [Cricetulus griseus]
MELSLPGGGARASGVPAPRARKLGCRTWRQGSTAIPRELREGLRGEALLTLDEEPNEGQRDDRVGNSPGEGLPPTTGPAPFNFKLTDFLVHNG